MTAERHPLVGLTVIDHGVVGDLAGTITAIHRDGTVGVTWKGRIGVCSIRPTAGRYSVLMPN